MADVYHALAYYRNHPREMKNVETEREAAMNTARNAIKRPDSVEPDSA